MTRRRKALVAALVAAATVLLSSCSSEPIRGTVIDRDFRPHGCDTGIVLVNGKTSVVTSCWGDEWTLVVQTRDGKVVTRSVDDVTYATHKPGSTYAEEGAR